MDREIRLSYMSGTIAYAIGSIYAGAKIFSLMGRIPWVRSTMNGNPKTVRTLNILGSASVLSGIAILYLEIKNSQNSVQNIQKNFLNIDSLRAQSEMYAALKKNTLQITVKKFALDYLIWTEELHKPNEYPIHLVALAAEIKRYSSELNNIWREAIDLDTHSADPDAKMILASIAIFQKFLIDNDL